ncbi:MAG: glycosyltransferase, partial [Lachnospiraceae bacterium]|nr:glycosyltransferase [Lachnospiraceae bacterium]
MENQKKLAVVICNHNKAESTVNCIASVLGSERFDVYHNLKIFVIDNASDDNSKS